MTEISVVAQEIVASRQRCMPADEGKLWEALRLDAERAAMGEEMLRGFLDLVVLRHDGFASALSLLSRNKAQAEINEADPQGSNRRRVTRRQARRHLSAAGLFFRGRQIRAARQLPGGAVA
jgi:Serine acetyltransferase, N-terminal